MLGLKHHRVAEKSLNATVLFVHRKFVSVGLRLNLKVLVVVEVSFLGLQLLVSHQSVLAVLLQFVNHIYSVKLRQPAILVNLHFNLNSNNIFHL